MSHQYDLCEQVKNVLSTKYFTHSPEVKELASGDILVSSDIGLVTDVGERSLSASMQIRCKEFGIVSRTVLKFNAPRHAYKRVVDLITQINGNKTLSCFEFDYRDGEIAARNFLRCGDYVPSSETIYTMIYDANMMFIEYGDRLIEAMDLNEDGLEKISPSEALDVLDEALKGNLEAQTILVDIIARDAESNYYQRLKEQATSGNELAKVLLLKCCQKQSAKSPPLVSNTTEKSGGGCYIATCVYGSYDCPQVWTLRRYRDDILSKSILGRAFIRVYYAVSPGVVRVFGGSCTIRSMWKKLLDLLVDRLRTSGVKDTPYKD